MITWLGYSEWITELALSDHDIWLAKTCKNEGYELGDLGVHLISDDELLEVNKEFLNHDTLTDIVSFDRSYSSFVTGELWISVERVAENAKLQGLGFHDEFDRVLVHGVLHFLGYKDKTAEEAEQMRFKENEALLLRAFKR